MGTAGTIILRVCYLAASGACLGVFLWADVTPEVTLSGRTELWLDLFLGSSLAAAGVDVTTRLASARSGSSTTKGKR